MQPLPLNPSTMRNIQMVDLKRQYLKIKPEIDAAMAAVIDHTAFINGPAVKSFADELAAYLDVKHIIPCANGTDALQIALMALNLKPGDEVITPSFTYIATVEVIALLGLKPVFVDVHPETFTMDPAMIAQAITTRTRAIIPVHLYGQSAAMEAIMAIADQHHLPVIEDTAQALGGHYIFPNGLSKKNGTMGLIGCTSFFPSKNLGCFGDGGAIFTNDDALFEAMSMIANHGQKVRYYHERVGCNSRLDSLQAAVLRVKLKSLDAYCDARRAAAAYYDKAFANNPWIHTPVRADYSHHVFHQYTLRLDPKIDRNQLKDLLQAQGIPSMIYYPVPCHKQQMFSGVDTVSHPLSVTDRLTPVVLSLPMHTELSPDELDYISTHVNQLTERLATAS